MEEKPASKTTDESSAAAVQGGRGESGYGWAGVEADIESIQDYYDRAASLISFGMMDRWRRKAAMETADDMRVLEVGSGPGSFSVHLKGREVVLLEPNENMLRRSVAERLSDPRYIPVIGVAEHLPFVSGTFDRVMSGFSFKNFIDRKKALSDIMRVLKPGGKVVIIDIALPDSVFRKAFMNFYMKHVLYHLAYLAVPRRIRKQWGRNPWKHLSYAYMSLGDPSTLSEEMRRMGFGDTHFRYLTTRGVAIVTGNRIS
ncbi:MAG: class I SAM-dependent methyltransferase [Thermoplasmata archaeon]|uniref:Class I SAM-dependent methyltransferase n=1 Tax=Candidatus Sysuiplasma superficiale TaxID=2823368 RepID=A0A8J7YYI5_9ARCH|nr:class I SAM-dependent methyltransferase [Candidatus Sysuiplasma superficiale]MBX8644751.1 class I SAM-dependent methyltransferase [Candidatus Sysuiplasma superficiale]MCL5437168.1 class I SAM-dependent methyltransferase [Candidatus Thermoplasmatota archaeon]